MVLTSRSFTPGTGKNNTRLDNQEDMPTQTPSQHSQKTMYHNKSIEASTFRVL